MHLTSAISSFALGIYLILLSMDYQDDLQNNEAKSALLEVSFVVGIISVIFSTVFVWNATELAILLFCGRQPQDLTIIDHFVKQEMRQVLEINNPK